MKPRKPFPRQAQHGLAMIEVLVALLITAFGILGFVGLQAQTVVSQLEGYQRTQALILLSDMAQRMSLNRSQAADYVAADVGVALVENCEGVTPLADKDLCEWGLLLQGATEVQDGVRLGTMLGARGCITNTVSGQYQYQYQISVVWQGLQATGSPATACGQGDFSSEDTRRAVTMVVHMATLGI